MSRTRLTQIIASRSAWIASGAAVLGAALFVWHRNAQSSDALAAPDSDQAQMQEEWESACVKHLDTQSYRRRGADAPPITVASAEDAALSSERASQRASLLAQLSAECPVLMRKAALLRSHFAAHPPPSVASLAALAAIAPSSAPHADDPRTVRALQFFAHCLSSQVELIMDFTADWNEADSTATQELALERAQEACGALLAALALLRAQSGSIELRASSSTAALTASQDLLQRTWMMLAAVCLRLGKGAEALQAADKLEAYLLSIKASELSPISAAIDGRNRAFSVQRWFDRLGSVLRLKSAAQTQLGQFAASAATDRAHLALLSELSAFLATGLSRDEKDRSRMPARVELAYLLKALPVATHLSHVLLLQAQTATGASSVTASASSPSVAASHRAACASLAIVRVLSRFYYCSSSFEDLALSSAARANGRQELARALQSNLEQQGLQIVQKLERMHAEGEDAVAEEETEDELEELRIGVSFFLTTHGGPPIDSSTRELASNWRLKPALLLMQVAAAYHQRAVVVTSASASVAAASTTHSTSDADASVDSDSVALSFASLRPDLAILQRMTNDLDAMEERVAARLKAE